ncbi:hypothetical protein ZHAS_00001895 [Anopheles sinensis]|uniref:Uncharacterized protein n=1 Tax=Anopheles sinensis TaxID=74873 RepID=A0A084VBN4_ANOSI|nr:hypothetical protein ZHAS_00001895 [Anopheles sinensis]
MMVLCGYRDCFRHLSFQQRRVLRVERDKSGTLLYFLFAYTLVCIRRHLLQYQHRLRTETVFYCGQPGSDRDDNDVQRCYRYGSLPSTLQLMMMDLPCRREEQHSGYSMASFLGICFMTK